MTRFRLRIGLLALGVLLGYGSAFAELRHHAHRDAAHHHCGFWE